MPRPSASELPSAGSLPPFQTPPNGLTPAAPSITPLSYAGQPLPPAPAVKTDPTPAGLFKAFTRRWVLGTFVSLLVAATVGTVVWLLMPGGKHEARALVNLREQFTGNLALKMTDDYESYKREQIFILKTRDLLQRTVNDAAVAGLEMIRTSEDPVRLLEESLTVTPAAPTILAVTMKGNEIEEMKVIVDTLVKKYVDDASATDRRIRDEQVRRLEKTELGIKDEIEALQRRIMLLSRTGVTGGESTEVRLKGLETDKAEVAGELTKLEHELARFESERTVAAKQLADGRPPLDPDLLRLAVETDARVAPLVAARDAARAQIEKDAATAADPVNSFVVKEGRQTLTKIEAALEERKKQVAGSIEQLEAAKALVGLKNRVAKLDEQIATAADLREKFKAKKESLEKSLVGGATGNAEVYNLRLGLAPQQDMLSRLQGQLVELRVRKELDPKVSIRESAQGLPNHNLNKKIVAAGGGGVGTFFVVALLISFMEWRTRRVDGVDQVVTELGMRIIGTVPAFPNRASVKAAAEAGGANWRFALNESINSTRTMLLHAARGQSMQVVMVTSATQGEGKTSLTSQLASSMAVAGMRTLVVDCDLRNPSIHKLFDLGVGPGVSEILVQEVDAADAVQPTAVPNLWVIPAGTCSNRVISALAQGHPLETLFNRLRGQFDFVIVDSCPVLPVADALLIGQHVDGVVFSIMQDISQLPKVLVASEKLGQLNIPLLGAVVNGIKQDVYSYGYNYVKQLPA